MAWVETAKKLAIPAYASQLTVARRSLLRQTLSSAGGLQAWRAILARLPRARFLLGQGKRGFWISFEAPCSETIRVRLLEGAYDHVPGAMERQALGDAIKRYNAEGLEGLFDRAKPGRPRKLNAAQEKELSELIIEGPDPDTDGISAYTLDDLVAIAKTRWQVTYHPWSMSIAIKRLGFSRQKARPHHPEKDEAAQEAFKGGFPSG